MRVAMAISRKAKIRSLVVFSFIGLTVLIAYLARWQVLTMQQAGLMVVAMLGLYVGFGILIVVYQMISKLE
jgi:hypothetical protein